MEEGISRNAVPQHRAPQEPDQERDDGKCSGRDGGARGPVGGSREREGAPVGGADARGHLLERGHQGGEPHGVATKRPFETCAKQGEVERGEDRGVLHRLHPGLVLRVGERCRPGSAHHLLSRKRGVVELGLEQPRPPALDGAGRVVEHPLVGERHERIGERLRRALIAAHRGGQRTHRGVDPLDQTPAGRLDRVPGDVGVDRFAVGAQQHRDQSALLFGEEIDERDGRERDHIPGAHLGPPAQLAERAEPSVE